MLIRFIHYTCSAWPLTRRLLDLAEDICVMEEALDSLDIVADSSARLMEEEDNLREDLCCRMDRSSEVLDI